MLCINYWNKTRRSFSKDFKAKIADSVKICSQFMWKKSFKSSQFLLLFQVNFFVHEEFLRWCNLHLSDGLRYIQSNWQSLILSKILCLGRFLPYGCVFWLPCSNIPAYLSWIFFWNQFLKIRKTESNLQSCITGFVKFCVK